MSTAAGFPLFIGTLVFLVMTTCHRGRELIWKRLRGTKQPLEEFLAELQKKPPVGRQTLVPARRSGLMSWRRTLFAFLNAKTEHPMNFFHIPPQQVVELGIELEI